MDTLAPEPGWSPPATYAADGDRMPGRPRRRYLTPLSATAVALALGAVGFFVGVRVEKSQVASSSSSSGGSGALASRLRALAAGSGGSTPAGAGTLGGGGSSATSGSGAAPGAGASGASGFGGLRALFGGGASGSATFGTVSSIDGRKLYVTSVGGNTVEVELSPSTKVTKSLPVAHGSIHPGDSVVVSGVKGSGGAVVAATVSDSGASSSSGSGSGSSGSGSSSGSSGSAIGSLFSNGG